MTRRPPRWVVEQGCYGFSLFWFSGYTYGVGVFSFYQSRKLELIESENRVL